MKPAPQSPTETVLVVEDEPAIADSVAYALRKAGFKVELAGALAEATAAAERADLILLDLMLPDGSGLSLLEGLRSRANRVPIIVLSSRDGEDDQVSALELGADDYVAKPFSPREVLARVKAVLRRAQAPSIAPAGLSIDAGARRAGYQGREMSLTRVEFDLLAELSASPERVFARSELINRVWGENFAITDRTIDSHIKSLRRKVALAGAAPDLIETVRGVGYRLNESA